MKGNTRIFYEELLSEILQCNGRDKRDPWNYADADVWDLIHTPNQKTINVLNTVIDVAIYKLRDNEKVSSDLMIMKKEIDHIKSEDDFDKWLIELSKNVKIKI